MPCRICGSGNLKILGKLPKSNRFAHGVYPGVFPESNLERCDACHSMQRSPVLTQEEYTALYSSGDALPWGGGVQRNDQKVIAHLINSDPSISSVLDVGAGDGALLSMLNTSLLKAAIEPSPSAQESLRLKSITIAGSDFSEIGFNQRYDAITIVDVIEHFVNPLITIEKYSKLLTPNGRIFISSGNPAFSKWANLWKSRFWYCSYQEHVTFPSKKGLQFIGKKSNLSLIHFEEIFYEHLSFGKRIRYIIQQSSYGFAPLLHKSATAIAKRFRFGALSDDYVHAHAAGVYRDHYVAILEKI